MSEEQQKKVVLGRIRVNGVRLSFAQQLFTPGKFGGREDEDEGPERYKANFLIPKNEAGTASTITATYLGETGEAMAMLKRAKFDAIKLKLGDEKAKELMPKVKADNYAVRDGEMETWEGYEGCWYISAAADTRPQVIGRDRRPIGKDDGIVYSGCYVNAIVTLWYQPAGKRRGQTVPMAVWARLNAVQFVKDGDAFGAAPVDTDSEFDDITDENDQMGSDFEDDESPL